MFYDSSPTSSSIETGLGLGGPAGSMKAHSLARTSRENNVPNRSIVEHLQESTFGDVQHAT